MRGNRSNSWRFKLDPRDPDYLDPDECEQDGDEPGDVEPDEPWFDDTDPRGDGPL